MSIIEQVFFLSIELVGYKLSL